MKKGLFLILIISLLSNSIACKTCHDCIAWLAENKIGKIHTVLVKISCSFKRLITRRQCCCAYCYKNNQYYRIKIISIVKDKFADGMIRCSRCGKHHICHVCNKKLCLVHCSDHDILLKDS